MRRAGQEEKAGGEMHKVGELIILFQRMCPLPRPSYAKKVCFGSYVIITGVAAYENDIVSSVVSPKEFMHIPDKCIIIECIFYEFILYVY